jgi:hypothetical protein
MTWKNFFQNLEKVFLLIILTFLLPVPIYFVVGGGLFPPSHFFLTFLKTPNFSTFSIFLFIIGIVYFATYALLYKFIINRIYRINNFIIKKTIIYSIIVILTTLSFLPIYLIGDVAGGSERYSISDLVGSVYNSYYNLYSNGASCAKEEESTKIAACYSNIAMIKNDFKLCEKVKEESFRTGCNRAIARKVKDISICAMGDGDWAKECYTVFADKNNDEMLCGNIKDTSAKNDCFWQIALAHNRLEVCEKITDNSIITSCKELIRK